MPNGRAGSRPRPRERTSGVVWRSRAGVSPVWHAGGVARSEDDRHRQPSRLTDEERQEGLFGINRARQALGEVEDVRSREPCPKCGGYRAFLQRRGGQNTVWCVYCNIHLYNAPKTETGERRRTVATVRRRIRPSQQARIFDRDHGRCVLCGRGDENLTIGHLLSIEDGLELGATEDELHDDANLAAMCEACNLGLGKRSVSAPTYARIMLHLVRAERRRASVSRGVTAPVPSKAGGRS